MRKSGITRRLHLQTNGDAITADTAEHYDRIFDLLDQVKVSIYARNSRGNPKDVLPELLPRNARKLKFVDRTAHWKLPDRKYPGTVPAKCLCCNFTLYAGEVWACASLITMIPQFGWNPADYSVFRTKLSLRFLDRLLAIRRNNQEHCQYCAVNKKIVDQLERVDE